MSENVVRFADYERRSLNPDACEPRNPSDAAVIIILPIIRVEHMPDEQPDHRPAA
jgi:hypothetical protein